MKIAFIGAGVMAEAIISGIIDRNLAEPQDIIASDIFEKRCQDISAKLGIRTTSSNQEALKGNEIIVLSVKPQVFSKIADDLRGKLDHDQLVLSIMAGVKIDTINLLLTHRCISRVMPNTPAQIGEGMSVWTTTDSVRQAQKDMVQSVLSALGKEIYVDEEKYIDMATAISGSGPAYVFLIAEAMIDAGVHIGLPRSMATELVMQTMLGSIRFAESSNKHLAELRNMVTSPGGTTAEGILKLEEGEIRAVLTRAVVAAYEKAHSLGKEQK